MASMNPIQAEKFLRGADYPARKEDLIECAAKNGADEQVRSTLEQLPDQQYNTPTDVSRAIGDIDRGSRGRDR